MNIPHYTFLSVVRTGLAGAITAVDTFNDTTSGRATFTASFSVTGNVTSPAPAVSKTVRVNGPSDVQGIDPRQVIRTEPKALTQNYEPNFFAAVEFDRPDFPWMMTPARETARVDGATDPNTASARLRPWVVLIAVRRQDGVSLTMQQGQGLPVLEIKTPAVPTRELQDLTDSWAWAHGQIVGDETDVTTAVAPTNPAHNSSRLLCPHRLKPLESYIACVVPAFKLGVAAGLGLPVSPQEETALLPAWTGQETAIKLPVYFHFEFNTGPNGDFEALADLLVPASLTADDVTIPLVIKATGDSRLPSSDTEAPDIRLDGALTAGEPPEFDNDAYKAALADIVSQAAPSLDPNDPDPIVAPPLYGRWHAAKESVAPGDGWLADLNLDPRRRIAAGLGTRIVQDQQEQLMSSAWDQLGEIQKINQTLKRAQLARAAMAAAHAKTVGKLEADPDRSYAINSPVLGRLLEGSTSTLAASLLKSRVPNGVASGPLRRLLRPRGAIGNRLFSSVPPPPGGGTPAPFPSLISNVNSGTLRVVPKKLPNGIVLGSNPVTAGGQAVFPQPTADIPDNDNVDMTDYTGNVPMLKSTTAGVQQHLIALKASDANKIKLPSARPALDVTSGLGAGGRIHPKLTLPPRVLSRILRNGRPIGDRGDKADPLEPIMAAPEFPQPMYAPLRDLSPDNLLPGLFRIPPNTVTLLDTNRQFIEAFLAGSNHEMSRELLWRGYPTDQRGTYFAQFWDPSCRVSNATNPDEEAAERAQRKDITPMHTWAAASRLGDHQPTDDPDRASGDEVVLVIRGELLRRYPNTIIYAAPGVTDASGNFDLDETKEVLPIFRGTIPPDVTFLGFNLTEQDVRDQQLYFVLQEQPTEPRFGLNEVPASEIDPTAPLTTWDNLSWGHFGEGAEFIKVGTLPNASSLPSDPTDRDNPIWGINGAHMARITLQTPVRVAIFGPDMLPAVTGP